MCIIRFSTQQRNGIYDMTNNLKIMISVRRGELTFFGVFIITITCIIIIIITIIFIFSILM